jgi:hypothetical protein
MYKTYTESTPDEVRLDCTISAIYHLATLEVVVKDSMHNESLILVLGSYAIGSTVLAEHGEGYWAPPNVATLVPFMGHSSPSTVGSVRRTIKKNGPVKKKTLCEMNQLAYSFGLKDTQITYRGSFIEIKHSPRTPETIRAFCIERYCLTSVDSDSLRNLADPEVKYGMVYAPIDENHPYYKQVYSPSHQTQEKWFLGKPLQSNITHIFSQEDTVNQLREKTISIPSDFFHIDDEGVICAIDISGYGRALTYAKEMHTFSTDGQAVMHEFRQAINELLVTFANTIGTTQLQIAGDGLICAFPKRLFSDSNYLFNKIIDIWNTTIKSLEDLNSKINDDEKKVGSRIAIHYGLYKFGRISGTVNTSSVFDGECIIEAARMEQGLSNSIEKGKYRHLLATSQSELVSILNGENSKWSSLGSILLQSKEYSKTSTVFTCATNEISRHKHG